MNNQSDGQPARIVTLTGANQVIPDPTIFMGISVADEGTGSIKIHVYHGDSDDGHPIVSLHAQSGYGDQFWYGPNGILCPDGLYVKVYNGTPAGCVFVK